MRSIEEIEGLSLEELEAIASDSRVEAPEGLQERIAAGLAAAEELDAEELDSEEHSKPVTSHRTIWAMAAAACAALVIAVSLPRQPKDTFDDPALAYAEIERTFAYISSKMDKGVTFAEEAESYLGRSSEVIARMNR